MNCLSCFKPLKPYREAIRYCYPCKPVPKEQNRLRCRKQWVRDKQHKIDVFREFGNKCNCCGELNPLFLTLDHVNGGGEKHRRKVGPNIWRCIKKEGYPRDKYQILCYNCNNGKERNGGICPHEQKEKT